MDDISELENRLVSALGRIKAGIDCMGDAADGDALRADIARLAGTLEDERTANAQLEERLRALRQRQDQRVKMLEVRTEKQKQRLGNLDRDLQRLRLTNQQLRANNAKLRAANAEGLADTDLIDTSMKAELDALRASRVTEIAEMDAVIDALTPILQEAS